MLWAVSNSATCSEVGRRPDVSGPQPVVWGYRPGLDGLRSVAVYLVVAFHAGVRVFGGGFVGVDLFFVLSGYVVTNVIIAEVESNGTLEVRSFYARRFRRLAPAAGACVLVTSAIYLLVKPVVERLSALNDAQAALLYYSNWHSIREAADYFAESDAPSPFVHFWSLAIEEQFYFAFPILIFVVTRYTTIGLRSRRFLLLVCSLIAASLASQLLWAAQNGTRAYYGTDARLYQILCGCAVAVVLRRMNFTALVRRSWAVAMAGLVGLGIIASSALHLSPSQRGVLATVCAVAIVVGLEIAPTAGPSRLLAWSPLVYLGSISYATYLWHWPILLVLKEFVDLRPGATFLVIAGLSTSVAALSGRLLEMPIRESRYLKRHSRMTIVASLGLTLLLATAVIPRILEDESPVRTVAVGPTLRVADSEVEPVSTMPVPRDISFADLAKTTVSVPPCNPDAWEQCTLVHGTRKHVLLIGDSIALELVPAFESIAARNDWTLTVNAVSGCSWQAGLLPRTDLSKGAQERCRKQRDDWYADVVPQIDPDVVVLAQLTRDEERLLEQLRPSDPSRNDWPLDRLNAVTIHETIQLFRSEGLPVVIIQPPPLAKRDAPDPLACLSAARFVGACVFEPVRNLPSEAVAFAESLLDAGVETVDLDPLVCPELPECVPVQRGVIAWRNYGHLTDRFIEVITPDVERLLLETTALGRTS